MSAPAAPATGLRGRDLLLASAWFGLTAGVLESAWILCQERLLGTETLLGPGVVWMAPVMDTLWVLAPGLAAALLVWWRPALWRVMLRVVLFCALTAFLLGFSRIHTYALLVLAAGATVQLGNVIIARADAFRRRLLPALLVTAAWVGIVGAASHLLPRLAFRRAMAALPAARAGAPNILLLILDTVRSASVSADGYERPTTPHLERLAASGVRFTDAYAPSAWTLSSHASMFTGYYPHQMSAGLRTPLDDAQPTVAEVLAEHGYATAGFAANLHYVSREYGLARGFAWYEDYVASPGELLLNSALGRYLSVRPAVRTLVGYYDIVGRKHVGRMNRDLEAWLDRAPDRPWFAFVNYYDAHEPYLPPVAFDTLFASSTQRKLFMTDQSIRGARRLGKNTMTDAEVRRLRESYEASIASLDDGLGRLFARMEAKGQLANTVVIVTSDHGEQFGEHGLFVHGNSLYQPLVHIPFILAQPGAVPAGRVVHTPVNARDLAATIVDLAGATGAPPLPGRSLRGLWSGADSAAPEPLFLETQSTTGLQVWRAIVQDSLTYLRRDSTEMLFDLRHDPAQNVNLADSAAWTDRLGRLRSTLDSTLAATGPDHWGP